jgi:predicted small metal-binding protein
LTNKTGQPLSISLSGALIITRCIKMSKIACADLGADCPYEAKGMDKKMVKEEFMGHMMEHHKSLIDSMSEQDMEEVKKKIDDKLDE